MGILNSLTDTKSYKPSQKIFKSWPNFYSAMRKGGFKPKEIDAFKPNVYGKQKSNRQLLKIIQDFEKDRDNKLFKTGAATKMKKVLTPDLTEIQKKKNILSQRESTRYIEEKMGVKNNSNNLSTPTSSISQSPKPFRLPY